MNRRVEVVAMTRPGLRTGGGPHLLPRPALVTLTGAVLIEVLWLVLEIGGPDATLWFSDLSGVVAPAVAAAACVIAGRRARDRRSSGWWALGAGCASWSAGQAIWSFYELALDREVPFPSAADVGFLGFYPFALVALLVLPAGTNRAVSSIRAVLDGLIVAGSLLFGAWALVIGPLLADDSLGGLGRVLALAYPVADVVLVTVALTVSRHRLGRTSPVVTLLVVGVAAIGTADVAFTYFTSSGSFATGSLVDAGWFTGFSLLALSAATAHRERRATDAAESGSLLWVYIPTLAVIAGEARPHLAPFVAVLGATVFALVVARQIASNIENRALTRHLEAQMRELHRRDEQFQLVLRATRDAVWDFDLASGVITWGDGIKELFGYTPSDRTSQLTWWTEHLHPADADRVTRSLDEAIATGASAWSEEYRFRHADGRWLTVQDRGFLVVDPDGSPSRMVGAIMDVSDRKRYETELAHRALHDPLTDLPNRVLLLDHLRRSISSPHTEGVALFFLDLDHFKRVNDSYGHAAGDEVIVAVAARLRRATRGSDVVARFGGDEFVILCEDVGNDAEARRVVRRLEGALAQPFRVGGRVLHLSASVGVALAQGDSGDAEGLLQSADTALYEAKARGRARHAIFNEPLRNRVRDELELTEALRHAIANHALSISYQPLVDLGTRRVIGAEALARWDHEGRAVEPSLFIRLAEEAGLVEHLGDWMLEEACREVASWSVAGSDDFEISVNLSPLQLTSRLHSKVLSVLEATGLPPRQLCLEVTESALMTDARRGIQILEHLRTAGVRIAIDDFGTGYSSLSYLNRLPVDVLKIDRSFVAGVDQDAGDDTITAAIVGIARAGGMSVVAEGIERESQVTRLVALGCQVGQGYLFSPPGPAAHLVEALRTDVLVNATRKSSPR